MRENECQSSVEELQLIADSLRLKSFEVVQHAGSGHLGGTSSSAELLTTLYLGDYLNFDPSNPDDPNRDIVIVRGHLGPLRYSLFSFLGMIPEEALWNYRRLGGLDGHEVMNTPGVDVAPNGSLGMGLSYGVGSALASEVTNRENKTIVFLGDGEMQEGNTLEAIQHAGSLELKNLVAIVDRNRGQLSCRTAEIEGTNYKMEELWESAGWEVVSVDDGHDVKKIQSAYEEINNPERDKPLVIIADTIKGKDLPGCEESFNGYHSTSGCSRGVIEAGIGNLSTRLSDGSSQIEELHERSRGKDCVRIDDKPSVEQKIFPSVDIQVDTDVGDPRATIVAYLNKLGGELEKVHRPLFVLTADFFPLPLAKECNLIGGSDSHGPYYNVGIREQHMLSLAYGIISTCPEAVVITSTADAFLYRYMDQLNAAAQGTSKQKAPNGFGKLIVLSDFAGLTPTTNGYTHTSSGQPGALLHMPGVKTLEPMDSYDLVQSLNKAVNENTLTVIRNHRIETGKTIVMDAASRNLQYYSVIEHTDPDVIFIGAGFPSVEAVKASEQLIDKGIHANVVNVVSLNELDENFVKLISRGVPIITVYNGNPSILSAAVSRAIMLYNSGEVPTKLVEIGFEFGKSGKQREVIESLGLDSESMIEIVETMLSEESP